MFIGNGIKRKNIPQEVMRFEYDGWIKDDDDIADVENYYRTADTYDYTNKIRRIKLKRYLGR